MNKKLIQEQEQKLKDAEGKLEGQLSQLAQGDQEHKGEWETRMPAFNAGTGNLEEEADEVEEYSTNLALSRNLEEDLENIKLALDKIKKGQYGLCEKCGKEIPAERMEVYPQARNCAKCR